MYVDGTIVSHRDLAAHTGDSRQTMYNLRNRGTLAFFEFEGEHYSKLSDANEWIVNARPNVPQIRSHFVERLEWIGRHEAMIRQAQQAKRSDVEAVLSHALYDLACDRAIVESALRQQRSQVDAATERGSGSQPDD